MSVSKNYGNGGIEEFSWVKIVKALSTETVTGWVKAPNLAQR